MKNQNISKVSLKGIKYIITFLDTMYQPTCDFFTNKKDLLELIEELDENAIAYDVFEISQGE
jgi:hypothetical protein